MATPRILSLCSGIGGLDIRVSRASGGRVVAYVERDAYAASVLLARMEDTSLAPAPVWCGNLEDMDASSLRGSVDILCAGFPCPPFSQAGKKLGADDERDLWPTVIDTIRRVEPGVVFLENVGGAVRHPDGLGRWLGDLAQLGFDAEYATLRAADVGAPHLRRRLFIFAVRRGISDAERDTLRIERQRDGQQRPEQGASEFGRDGPQGDAADANGGGREGQRLEIPPQLESARGDQPDGCGQDAPNAARWEEGASGSGPSSWWARAGDAPEPCLRGVANGTSARVDRLRCLGNAVVPQQAEHAYRELARRLNL